MTRLTDAVERLGEMVEYLEAVGQDYILVGGRKLHTDDLRLVLSALDKEGELTEAMIEAGSEAVYDFLHERFPEGAMPGGQQLFADDHLDAEFKHEAGCEALAMAMLKAAMTAARTKENGNG